jgi:hypothetical protein
VLSLIERKANPILDLSRMGTFCGVEVRLSHVVCTPRGLVLASKGAETWDRAALGGEPTAADAPDPCDSRTDPSR